MTWEVSLIVRSVYAKMLSTMRRAVQQLYVGVLVRSAVRHTLTLYLQSLQDSPHLVGRSYELFVRTLCPSVLAHIKYTALAGLVKSLDLGHIVHNSTKATTARKASF